MIQKKKYTTTNRTNQANNHNQSNNQSNEQNQNQKQNMSGTISYHCWVVDTDTGKVIDPEWPSYRFTKEIRNLEGETQYQKYPHERMEKLVNQHRFQEQAENLKYMYDTNPRAYEGMKRMLFIENNCSQNALFSFVENGAGKNLEFCVGRMGWKQQDGKVFWEYE